MNKPLLTPTGQQVQTLQMTALEYVSFQELTGGLLTFVVGEDGVEAINMNQMNGVVEVAHSKGHITYVNLPNLPWAEVKFAEQKKLN